MNKWIDLTEDLTDEAQTDLQVGQVLMFKNGKEENNLKIMRKKGGKIWAKHVIMYRPDQIEVVDSDKIDKL